MAKTSAKLNALLDRYYARLDEFKHQYALHEGAVSEAFQTLLADAARPHHWTLIPQLTDKQAGKHIRPDGTFKDIFGLVRGHWEAKDTKDDLNDEVTKKTKKGYPLGNIIFEDTREAILIQNKVQIMRVDQSDRQQLITLLDQFFDYIEPQIESFEEAVDEFKERVPDIAKHLKQYIEQAHHGNGKTGSERVLPIKKFNEAFAKFMEVCKTALNPNITEAAIDDMLVQHLMTERLIREIFDNPEFTRRNVIASEIEKVIDALTSRSFDRNVFLKSLDRFYIAIENAARTITEWSDKQGFLNTVYERFFQGYSVKLADTMGIVYTPQPIVDFMCASVVEVLEKEFGRSLGDPGVNILDPCTGTGNFIVNLLRRVPKKDLPRVYREQLFANEIMLLPYYIAALNIEHAYYEQTGEYEPFEGLCFVDTLDLAESHQAEMSFMTAKNTERVERQKRTPITVIIGNPPYNVGQQNENDRNRNRAYSVADSRISETYAHDSKATLRRQLYDPYVQFFRWATDRLGGRAGIVCFVSNNSYVDQVAFDGMRANLARDFDDIFIVDLHGNVRQNPKLSGTTHNVFGIQVGVSITVAVRRDVKNVQPIRYFRVPEAWRREQKYDWLRQFPTVGTVKWNEVQTDSNGNWNRSIGGTDFNTFAAIGSKEAKAGTAESIFQSYCRGAATNADAYVYAFERNVLSGRAKSIVDDFNGEWDRWRRLPKTKGVDVESFLRVNEKVHKWVRKTRRCLLRNAPATYDSAFLRNSLYRPFVKMVQFFDPMFNEDLYRLDTFFPNEESHKENQLICVPGVGGRAGYTSLLTNAIPSVSLTSLDSFQCFPSTSITKTAATVGRTSPTGRSISSARSTRTRRSRSGTFSTASTACCIIRGIARSLPTT